MKLTPTDKEPSPIGTADEATPEVGKWYWLKIDDGTQRLVCVTAIGSNYYEVRGVQEPSYASEQDDHESEWRIHFDEWMKKVEFEPNAGQIIEEKVRHHRRETNRLMAEVKDLTMLLSVDPTSAPKSDAQALAVRSGNLVQKYKADLIEAKEKKLPALFDQIAISNKKTAAWMKAELIPLRAKASAMKPVIKAIEDRIFSVEIYAGLVETVVQIQDGEPPQKTEKVKLYQRRRYMDEECLARYETGGMTFKDLKDFDAWILKQGNLSRLLPSKRCIVAFKVRRKEKEYDIDRDFGGDWRAYVSFCLSGEKQLDELTFLYMRNGEQVYRLSTEIHFKDPLFPDLNEDNLLTSKQPVYAEHEGYWQHDKTRIKRIISVGEYEQLKEEKKKEIAEDRREQAAWWREVRKCANCKSRKQDDRCTEHTFAPHFGNPERFSEEKFNSRYTRFDLDTVYYDDIKKYIDRKISEYNRLVLLLQGIFDRSPVFVPHAPAKLWSDFGASVEMVYDDSRALNTGRAPIDFEEYRRQLNSGLKVGDVVIGQEYRWKVAMAEIENQRRAKNHRYDRRDALTTFKPAGNPGPGKVARVVAIRGGKAIFKWIRRRRSRADAGWEGYSEKENLSELDSTELLNDSFACPIEQLFNVSAYTPGDFKLFFDDPRTRKKYTQWAWWMLTAEEVKAGHLKPNEQPKAKPKPKRSTPDYHAQFLRERRKKREALYGKTVRNKEEIHLTNGKVYEKGLLWKCEKHWSRKGKLRLFWPDGEKTERAVHGIEHYDVEIAE